ncbi:hypothetical protein [Pectobacterium aquaticum]|uniref:hypothetical protein n=1 Tax=Pectobacterium aquaticum TaxID=2204145 RepID=UPI0021F7E543|nr:hypothetical protein [Pectobacterium aquaticum]
MLEAVLYGVFTLAVIFVLEYHDVHNEIAHQDNQHSTNIKVNSDETQIVYWTIIKCGPIGRQCVSDDVADRLLDYTYRLRASTIRPVTSGTDFYCHRLQTDVCAGCLLD